MKNPGRIGSAGVAVLALLAGCGHSPPAPWTASSGSPYAAPAPRGAAGQRTSFGSVDSYKVDVAEHIIRNNPAHTFTGQLPPMLPAIVVLSITVDRDGKPTRVAVQRSRDNDASNVALASVQRSGYLPKPFNLLTSGSRTLTFSETFLFNADYRFQLRSLAPVQ